MILNRPDIVKGVKKRTKFIKSNVEEMIDALEELIIDSLSEAEVDDNVEVHLSKGLVIGSRFVPEHPAKNPQDQSDIIVPDRILPYVRFTDTFKQKINK